MPLHTVDWTARLSAQPREGEGLRERKKRLLRQQLSDTATELFIERGFDAVRVADVAMLCGVSEKTVYNYFPTKESLVLDRWESTLKSLQTGLADAHIAPTAAVPRILSDELRQLTSWLAAQPDAVAARTLLERFGQLLANTPALRAYQADTTDRMIDAATVVLARRMRQPADDARPRIAAIALLGLWDIQARSLERHLSCQLTPDALHRAVSRDVARAARLIDSGLGSLRFGDVPQTPGGSSVSSPWPSWRSSNSDRRAG